MLNFVLTYFPHQAINRLVMWATISLSPLQKETGRSQPVDVDVDVDVGFIGFCFLLDQDFGIFPVPNSFLKAASPAAQASNPFLLGRQRVNPPAAFFSLKAPEAPSLIAEPMHSGDCVTVAIFMLQTRVIIGPSRSYSRAPGLSDAGDCPL
jgi:hypothetical protein